MFDKVTITYRGATYEIGRGRDFYGIWAVGGSRSQPLQWWPETTEGWSAAWTRFTEIEVPSTIAAVGRAPRPSTELGPDRARPCPARRSTATQAEGTVQAGGSRIPLAGSTGRPAGTALLDERTAPPGRESASLGQAVPRLAPASTPFGASPDRLGRLPAGAIAAARCSPWG